MLEEVEYHDYWEGDQLVYCARGQKGDQKLAGANRLLAENTRVNYVLESLGGSKMLFHGTARSVRYWWDDAPDIEGSMRQVIRYLLVFDATANQDESSTFASEEVVGMEGASSLRLHISVERSRALVAGAKRRWRRLDPKLRCEDCTSSFLEIYGQRGSDFIEAHHRMPLSELSAPTPIRIADLAPVCSNCHRMLHARGGCSIDELRAEIAATTAGVRAVDSDDKS